MSKKIAVAVLVVALLLPVANYGQYVLSSETGGGKLGIYSGLTMPVGDFSHSSGAYAGGAQMGYTIGVDYLMPLPFENTPFAWISSLAIMVNGTDLPHGFSEIEIAGDETPWYHIAPMVGLRYSRIVGKTIDLYASLQGGAMYGNSPEIEATTRLETAVFTHAYQRSGTAWTYVAAAEVGMQIAGKVDVGLHALQSGLFSYQVQTLGKYFRDNNIPVDYQFTLRQPVSLLQFRVGYFFGS